VRTVLSLDDVSSVNTHEAKVATQLGMTAVAIPMNSFLSPSDKKMAKIRAVLLDPSNKPLFVHCKHGEDRTGLVIGLYRFQDQNWSAKDAYDEMENLGFHKVLFGLYLYFKKQTGYDNDDYVWGTNFGQLNLI
jgi:protein tyrosine/serine phosphatase